MAEFSGLLAGPWGPVIIFFLRVVDVSLATSRMLLMMRGAKLLAPALAFFEILIWIVAIGGALKNLSSAWHVLGYAAGFASGTFVGMLIEERLAFGYATARVMTKKAKEKMGMVLREMGYGVTEYSGQGLDGPVGVCVSTLRRRDIGGFLEAARSVDPDVFITVEETSAITRGWLFQRRRK